jgi:hypothetical protein
MSIHTKAEIAPDALLNLICCNCSVVLIGRLTIDVPAAAGSLDSRVFLLVESAAVSTVNYTKAPERQEDNDELGDE